jgi:hypothetical protein
MSLLKKPDELQISQNFKGLIYGQPGVGKSTLALSAPNPVLIDFDKGMHRVQPQFRVPSLPVDNYSQVLELLNSDEIKQFDTIIFDTLGKTIDRICDYVAQQNPKLRQADGQMSMKGWGNVKATFQNLLKILETKNKSILFVAHEKEEKNGDETIKRPDVSGSSGKDIVKELDFMGYMEMVGGRRTISFSPSEKFYAKNSLDLVGHIEVPDTSKGNTFISKDIVKLSQERLTQQAKMRSEYESLISLIEGNIDDLKTVADINSYYAEMGKKQAIWDSALVEKRRLSDRCKELSVEFDKTSKQFVSLKQEKKAA